MHNPYAAPQAGLALPFAPAGQARLLGWHGRIGRVRFVAYCLLGFPMAVLFAIAAVIVSNLPAVRACLAANAWASEAIGFAIPLVLLLPMALATRRRLHDIDVSSWWALMLLFPILQFVFVIYLLVAPGTAGANDYGAAPRPPDFGLKLGAALGCALLAGFTGLRFL